LLEGISNTTTINSTPHSTVILKDQIDWNQEENIQFFSILGHYGLEVNERGDLEQAQWKYKCKEELQSLCQNKNVHRRKLL
jgi:hypothetical protein